MNIDSISLGCHSQGIATGHQGCSRRAAHGLTIEIREEHPFLGHVIDVGRFDVVCPVAAEILVALVVREDDDEVRLFRFAALAYRGECERQTDCPQKKQDPQEVQACSTRECIGLGHTQKSA